MSYTKQEVEEFLQKLHIAKESNPSAYLPSIWEDIEKQIKAKLDTYS